MPTVNKPNSARIAIVSLRWNGEPLAMRAARPGEEVVVGDAEGALAPLPHAALGADALVVADAQGGPHVRIPAERVAKITGAGGAVRLVAGPARERLSGGEEASLVLGDFEVLVAAHEDEPVKGRRRVAAGAWTHIAVVASVHAALLFAGSRAALAGSITTDDTASLDALRGYLAAAEARSITPDRVVSGLEGKGDERVATGRHGNGKQGGGERHAGEEGKAGSTTSRDRNRRWGAEGPSKRGDAAPEVDSIDDARDFGMVGLLRAANSAAVRPIDGTSPWGTDDAFTAMGGMLGRALGDAEGSEGLALSGIGEGGGGSGEGIGLGRIGTIGHIDGLPGPGTGGVGTLRLGSGGISSWSSWDGVRMRMRSRSGYGFRGVHCRCGETSVEGRLPPETVQRIVRQSFGRFRACYNEGLRSNPALAGRVTTRFVIGRDGSVVTAGDGGSDLPDAGVRACVHRAFSSLSFPQPEGGIVTVAYPILFSGEL